jgi:hypothetical protein
MNRGKDVPLKVERAFRILGDIELAGSRERERDKYNAIISDIGVWLELRPDELTPLNLDRETAPPWVKRFPELAFYWERGREAYLDLSKVRRRTA